MRFIVLSCFSICSLIWSCIFCIESFSNQLVQFPANCLQYYCPHCVVIANSLLILLVELFWLYGSWSTVDLIYNRDVVVRLHLCRCARHGPWSDQKWFSRDRVWWGRLAVRYEGSKPKPWANIIRVVSFRSSRMGFTTVQIFKRMIASLTGRKGYCVSALNVTGLLHMQLFQHKLDFRCISIVNLIDWYYGDAISVVHVTFLHHRGDVQWDTIFDHLCLVMFVCNFV